MKFKPLFLLKLLFVLIISLATVSFLIDIHPVSAQNCHSCDCNPSFCPKIGQGGTVGGGTKPLPEWLRQKVNDLIAQEKFTEAESQLIQFLKQKKSPRYLIEQAVAHQALGDLYTIMNKPDLASSQLMSAKALYQALENSQGFSQVEAQLQEIQSQQIQIQLQPGEVQVRQLPEIPTERLLRTIQAPQIRPEIVSPQIQSLQR